MCQYTTNAGDKGLSVANVKPIQNTMLAVSADSSETKIPESHLDKIFDFFTNKKSVLFQ